MAGAGDHRKFGQSGQVRGVAPFGQLSDMISPYEVEQGGEWKPGDIVSNGVDSVGGAFAAQLLVVDVESGTTCERESQKAEPTGCGGGAAAGFERRLSGWDEDDSVEFQFLLGGLSHEQVAVVNRIKGPAEQSDPTRIMPRDGCGLRAGWHARWNGKTVWRRSVRTGVFQGVFPRVELAAATHAVKALFLSVRV